ncbi:hypothetical protein C2S51_019645 [Perilla frutescens var. frutescens]|nr:hypothetical protein C2S51_019645 [Perilla frutescens var. frutescens]
METTLMPYLLPLLLLPLSLYLILFIHKKGSDDLKNLPPGSNGWPIVGENAKLAVLGFQTFVKDRMEKFSPDVFQTSLLGEKMVVFCGAQGNKFLFSNDNKLVTPWLPQSFRKVVLPEFEGTNYNEQLALFHNFQYDVLKPEALKQYIPVMDSLAREQLHRAWRPNSVVKFLPFSKKYTFELSCRLFMSVADPERVKKLLEPFTEMSNGMLSVPINLPGTAYSRAIKGGKKMREEMTRIVKERRKEESEGRGQGQGRDLLSKMLLLSDEDGKFVSDTKIANFFVGLMVASHDSTSSAITAVINYLAQLPHIYDQVLTEQMEIAKSKGPDDELTWEDVEKMKYSWNVAREALRLAPPAQGTFGEATTEFTYAGFTIPKGWKTFWTVHTSHKNPDYFPEPEKFDPSRFEGSGPAPYTFVPFGGGPRLCPGRNFAKLAILVFMHNVVTRFRLEKAIPNEKMVFNQVTPAPAHGLPLHLYPHKI